MRNKSFKALYRNLKENYGNSEDNEMLDEGNEEKEKSSKNNYVAKHMNKFNKAHTHRDKKNDYKRKSKYKKSVMEEGGKRKVKVTYDNGSVVTTSMAANLSDEQIKAHFKIGKEFNLGNGGGDKMVKVKSVTILEDENKATILKAIIAIAEGNQQDADKHIAKVLTSKAQENIKEKTNE